MVLNKRKKDEDEILDTGVNNYPNLGSKDTVKKLAEDYANYNYDTFTGGDSYKSLEKRYQTGGQKAMQDTVGQVSARTGGLASSYATVAGQQTYNDWMGNLESAARALYESERQEMGDRYALANSMYLQERDEQRYADELAYNRARDQLADQRYADELAYNRKWNEDERTYNRGRDQLADERYIEERDYNRAWNEDERTYNRQWNEDERTYNRQWNEDERTYNRGRDQLADERYIEERDYNRVWNEDERTYNRQWNEDERDYNRSENQRLEGENDAITTIQEMIAAGVPVEDIDPALIEQSGYGLGYWGAYATNYNTSKSESDAKEAYDKVVGIINGGGTISFNDPLVQASGMDETEFNSLMSMQTNAKNANTLEQYGNLILNGDTTITLEQWLAVNGDPTFYNSYKAAANASSNSEKLTAYRNIIANGGNISKEVWLAADGTEAEYEGLVSINPNVANAQKLEAYTNNILNGMDVTLEQWKAAGGTEADYNMYKGGYTTVQNNATLKSYADIIASGGNVSLEAWKAVGGTEAVYNGYMSARNNSNNQNILDEYKGIIASGGDVTLEQWKAAGGDKATYNSIMSVRANAQAKADETTTKEQADATIKNYIDAFGKLEGLDESWFDKSSMPKDYWTSEVQKATNSSNQNTLAQYMVSLSDGVFVDRQAFIDAGGDAAVYDAYKKVYDDAKAEGEAADKATVATSALNTLIATNADVDWDSDAIKQLITDSGKSALEWDALIAEAQEIEDNTKLAEYKDIIASGGTVSLADWKDAGGSETLYNAYVSVEDNKQAGENKQTAIDEAWAHINASGNVDDLTDDQIAATGYSRGFWKNQQTLFEEGKATEESQTATMELTTALEAGMNLEDIEGYEDLVEKTGLSMLYWTAIDMATDSEGEAKAYQEIMAAIDAGKFDDVTDELIAKSGYSKSYFEYMKAIKMEEDSSSEYANNIETVFAALQAGMSLADINAKDPNLIGNTGKDAFYWEVVEKQFEKERQAELDAKTAKEIAEAEADAFEDVEMRIAGGESLTSIGSGMLASTGKSYEYWLAYENILNSQASAKDMAVFYEVNYDTVNSYIEDMDEITTYEEAVDFTELVASATGNRDFADELLTRWYTRHSNTPRG